MVDPSLRGSEKLREIMASNHSVEEQGGKET